MIFKLTNIENQSPTKETRNKLRKIFLGWFLLGILIGATSTSYFLNYQIENLYWEKTELEQELSQTENRMEKLEEELRTLEEKWEQDPSNVVKDANIVVDYEDNPQVVLAIKEFCQDIAQEIIGYQINKLEPELIFQMFDNRSTKVEEQEYKINVNSLIISERLTLWIEPEKVNN
ncbi:hypothetical protein [Natranaerobius thermophilus]|uniref:Sporulation membrane protein YtrI C-terminal domain-containing protein n=1 Tax=Natranaerobius thermophilus (strain ATCC BAA-1301 / DSM 18059 / JW/NM-WN-LF) TaxID=457570 RepID=B2A6D2_NATTJ|nr:hypothetical protein [Natranaerobius thermophilus]ACB84143.1 conserved hypothetical protein [Natranaerobius thermophilus JW/NM-WN-LF]